MGFSPSYFSFNSEGGRCEECKGEGTITVEMQFMADIVLECESCHGKRYKQDVLDIEYRGKNISDVLDMTINQAIEFFFGGERKSGEAYHKAVEAVARRRTGIYKIRTVFFNAFGRRKSACEISLFPE